MRLWRLGVRGVLRGVVAAFGLARPQTPDGLDLSSCTHLLKALADWSIAHRPVIAAAREAYDGRSAADPV